MPDGGHAAEIERRVGLGERVDSGRDVEKRLGPAAARADPPVLEVPGGKPVRREIEAERGHERAVVPRAPVAAVHDDGDGMRPGALGQEELDELARVAAVAMDRRRPAHGRVFPRCEPA